MSSKKTQTLIISCLLLFSAFSSTVEAVTRSIVDLRNDFLQAERYITKNKDAEYFKLANSLKDYPLYPYLQYQWLKKNLEQAKAVQKFLKDYRSTRYAPFLKKRWLRFLARRKDWTRLIKYYRSSSSAELQCYYHWAKYKSGHKKVALTAAKKLWVKGKSQPDACDPLFKILIKSKYLTRDMLWQRFQASLSKGRVPLAKYVQGLMGRKDRKVAELWIKVHQKPKSVIRSKNWHKGYKQAGLMFAQAIDRIARNNPSDAAAIWDAKKWKYTIPKFRVEQINRRLALALAFQHDTNAYSRFEKLKNTDPVVREWQIRAALNEGNWQHVEKSLANLTLIEKQENNWQYWKARANAELGRAEEANRIFNILSTDRSFYGFLSANLLNKDIHLANQPLNISAQEISSLEKRKPFKVVAELLAIDRKQEAKGQWWFAVRKLDKNEIMVAAKLAEKWHWNQEAIFTIAKAKHWDDVALRFPMKYTTQVKLNAKQRGLDPAIVFGLIRRESAFDEKAQSPVGARGLMQIMPRTGRQIARELKEKWRATSRLFNPALNVKYGTYYYKQLLDRFNGHYALAAAAYNAGPHRVKRWLPTGKAMAADIWIETIPFKETRAYVSAVLAYALIYQQRLQRNVLKIEDFMRDILPG